MTDQKHPIDEQISRVEELTDEWLDALSHARIEMKNFIDEMHTYATRILDKREELMRKAQRLESDLDKSPELEELGRKNKGFESGLDKSPELEELGRKNKRLESDLDKSPEDPPTKKAALGTTEHLNCKEKACVEEWLEGDYDELYLDEDWDLLPIHCDKDGCHTIDFLGKTAWACGKCSRNYCQQCSCRWGRFKYNMYYTCGLCEPTVLTKEEEEESE